MSEIEGIDPIGVANVRSRHGHVSHSVYEEEVPMVIHWLKRDGYHRMEDDRKGRYIVARLWELEVPIKVWGQGSGYIDISYRGVRRS